MSILELTALIVAANVETMLYSRTTPLHGLGRSVDHAVSSDEAIIAARLNWKVIQKEIYSD